MTLAHGTDRLESARLVLRRVPSGDMPVLFTRIHALHEVVQHLMPQAGRARLYHELTHRGLPRREKEAGLAELVGPSSGQNRRIFLVAAQSGEGPLTERTAATQLWGREPLFLPPHLPFATPSATGSVGSGSRHPQPAPETLGHVRQDPQQHG
jgi:hypothetical protein